MILLWELHFVGKQDVLYILLITIVAVIIKSAVLEPQERQPQQGKKLPHIISLCLKKWSMEGRSGERKGEIKEMTISRLFKTPKLN